MQECRQGTYGVRSEGTLPRCHVIYVTMPWSRCLHNSVRRSHALHSGLLANGGHAVNLAAPEALKQDR